MNYLFKILKGILIGIAAIIPGFSGGTIACIAGCYDEIIEAISGIRIHFKKSIVTLIPYVIGILIGACSLFIVSWGLKYYPLITICLFAGLLLGSLPSFCQNIKGQINKKSVLIAVISGLLFLGLILLNLFMGEGNYFELNSSYFWVYILLFFAGALGSAALVVPGISGSMMLMIIGFYNPIMDTIKGFIESACGLIGIEISMDYYSSNVANLVGNGYILPAMFMLICFALGIIIGFYLISKLMKYLLSNHRSTTYHVILAFILVSLVGIYAVPEYYNNLDPLQIVLAIIFLIIGGVISFFISKVAEKKANNNIGE